MAQGDSVCKGMVEKYHAMLKETHIEVLVALANMGNWFDLTYSFWSMHCGIFLWIEIEILPVCSREFQDQSFIIWFSNQVH